MFWISWKTKLRCRDCKKKHDLDIAPDEGFCVHCGKPLQEPQDGPLKEVVLGPVEELEEATRDRLEAAARRAGKIR